MKRLIKGIVGVLSLAVMAVGTASYVSADTGIYVGADVSSDGTTIIARSADYVPGISSRIDVVSEAVNGDTAYYTQANGFSYRIPEQTYKYQIIERMDSNGLFSDCDAITNEYGLCITASTEAQTKEEALAADPYADKGIQKDTIVRILGASCRNAKEAALLLADIVEEYGSASGCIVVMADQEESWYLEIYTGHQYAAVKMPADKVAVYGECFRISSIDDKSSDAIVSDSLLTLPEENHFAKYDNNKLDIARTYGEGSFEGELFADADDLVGLDDVIDVYRNRYEGSALKLDKAMGEVTNENTDETHIIQIYKDVPAEMSEVMWVSLSAPQFTPFVPVVNVSSSIPESYSLNVKASGYQDGIAAYTFERLSRICEIDPDNYGGSITAYWDGQEKLFARTIEACINDWATEYISNKERVTGEITDVCTSFMNNALTDSEDIFDELMWYMMHTDQSGSYYYSDASGELLSSSDGYVRMFDIEEYANQMGWETSSDGDNLICVRGSKQIMIEYSDEESTAYIDDVDEENEEEDDYAADSVVEGSEEDSVEEVSEEEASLGETDNNKIEDEDAEAKEEVEEEDAEKEEIEEEAAYSVELPDINIGGVTEEDVISVIEELSPEAKDYLGSLFGVDVDEAIEAFKDENSQVDVDVDIEITDEQMDIINSIINDVTEISKAFDVTIESTKEDSTGQSDADDAEESIAEETVAEDTVAEDAVVEDAVEEDTVTDDVAVGNVAVEENEVEENVQEEAVPKTTAEEISDDEEVAAPEAIETISETAVVEAPVVETQVVETPVDESPAEETPVVDIPIADTPVVEASVTEIPVVEAPVSEESVIEVPVSEESVVEESVSEAASEALDAIADADASGMETAVSDVISDSIEDDDTAGDNSGETVQETITEDHTTQDSASIEQNGNKKVKIKVVKRGKKMFAPANAMSLFV